MERQSQLELFKSQQYQQGTFKKSKYRPNFFGLIKLHEKAISIIIVLFIVSLISFSLGVEKGKRLAGSRQLKQEESLRAEKIEDEQEIRLKDNKPEVKPEVTFEDKKDISKYTIQVATFKTKTYAQKEAKRLEGRGVEALIIPRGKFVCVCVGNFSEKKEAKITLDDLKKTYHDCFIRRL